MIGRTPLTTLNNIGGMGMKRLNATMLTLSLLAATVPLVNQAGAAPRSDAVPAKSGQDSQTISIARSGSQPSQQGGAERFTGSVRIDPVFSAKEPSRTSGGSVTFKPGARTAWHTHPLGQVLIVTAGTGRIQSWGGPIQEIWRGDVVRIPPGVKHWHGASPNAAMTHIAIQEEINGSNVVWMEKVSDEQYGRRLTASQRAKGMNKEPSAIKRTFGDFAPKLVQLTDDVLFGDVWERADLSKRDRSLVTVAALIAGGNTEQLSFHLNRARENGLTETELIEAITHLAFYSGWPKAMSAITLAKELFEK
jgi:4-carboxymuconolactone decarboxylase